MTFVQQVVIILLLSVPAVQMMLLCYECNPCGSYKSQFSIRSGCTSCIKSVGKYLAEVATIRKCSTIPGHPTESCYKSKRAFGSVTVCRCITSFCNASTTARYSRAMLVAGVLLAAVFSQTARY